VYAVGFQEIVDLNAINVALDNRKTQSRAVQWSEKIADCLNSVGNYTMISEKHLVGLLLCVFVKKNLVDRIKDVRTCSTGVGIMGVLGNKGGIGISMNIFDSSICFIVSHLAAHTENVEGRNMDFRNIIERSVFLSEYSSSDRDREEGSFDQVTLHSTARHCTVQRCTLLHFTCTFERILVTLLVNCIVLNYVVIHESH
jgi:hypothetical protein